MLVVFIVFKLDYRITRMIEDYIFHIFLCKLANYPRKFLGIGSYNKSLSRYLCEKHKIVKLYLYSYSQSVNVFRTLNATNVCAGK